MKIILNQKDILNNIIDDYQAKYGERNGATIKAKFTSFKPLILEMEIDIIEEDDNKVIEERPEDVEL